MGHKRIDKGQLFLERGFLCEHCQMIGVDEPRSAHDAHHVFFRRDKHRPELDVPENIALVNHHEHIRGDFDNIEFRRMFWTRQCNRYGAEHMEAWLASLDTKVKHYDFTD